MYIIRGVDKRMSKDDKIVIDDKKEFDEISKLNHKINDKIKKLLKK